MYLVASVGKRFVSEPGHRMRPHATEDRRYCGSALNSAVNYEVLYSKYVVVRLELANIHSDARYTYTYRY